MPIRRRQICPECGIDRTLGFNPSCIGCQVAEEFIKDIERLSGKELE